MNWKLIKDKYPKAYSFLTKNGSYSIHSNGLFEWVEEYSYLYPLRDLYDFFDENGIIIGIEFSPGNKVLPSDIIIFYYDFWIDGIPAFESKGYFNARIEAEEAAFLKGFEVLENKLEKNEKI